MSETISSGRTISIDALTRLEGEGGLTIRMGEEGVEEVRLDIFEPPRFFESLLRGRSFDDVADMTARICGICPVAHQVTAVRAIESLFGIDVGPEITMLRRLMYLGEWIESHALHIYLLNAPDFLGYESAITLAGDHPQLVERGLRLKKCGNAILELLGGRATNPVSLRVGGFHRVPSRSRLLAMKDELAWALDASVETLAIVSKLTFPEVEIDYDFVSLEMPDEFAIDRGRIVSSSGLDTTAGHYEEQFREEQVAHSTALHSVRTATGASYFVGPLARVNLQRSHMTERARDAAASCGIAWPSRNPFHGIVARAIELIQACEESLSIVDAWREPASPAVPARPRAGTGCAATEAPRGLLFHRYDIDASGIVLGAKIIPPTAQNLLRMEDDLRLLVPAIAGAGEAEIARRCENLIRTYDPCISCSTHFLRLRIEGGSS